MPLRVPASLSPPQTLDIPLDVLRRRWYRPGRRGLPRCFSLARAVRAATHPGRRPLLAVPRFPNNNYGV